VSEVGLIAIESSTREVSLVGWVDGGVVFEDSFCTDRRHNARVFGPLEELLERMGGVAIECVLVGTGPGSYSGTRVGIAAAQGVGIARACPVAGISSLLATPEARSGEAVVYLGDARRGAWWHARVAGGRLVESPAICEGEELRAVATEALAAGEAVLSFDPFERLGLEEEQARRLGAGEPSAGRLVEVWLEMAEDGRRALMAVAAEPFYIRPPHITEAK
jgi:tRNA threonylcarbamoyl adenosine modification protein YeaZ